MFLFLSTLIGNSVARHIDLFSEKVTLEEFVLGRVSPQSFHIKHVWKDLEGWTKLMLC